MIVPLPPTGRRPPFYVYLIAFVVAVLAIHSIIFGIPPPPSSIVPKTFRTSPVRPPWLIITVSAAAHMQRRQIIRQTWQHLFKNESVFDTRFVISDPGPLWQELIERENKTHGDIIMLHHDHESHKWANTVKTLETLKWLQEQGLTYTFISKMDEDSFVDAKTFWRVWLEPRIRDDNIAGTYIGRKLKADYPMVYGSGQFYTLSWDLVTLLVKLFGYNHINDEHEDVLMARLMYEAQIPYNLTVLPLRVAFDYYEDKTRGDQTAWAPHDQDVDTQVGHALAPGAINPHLLKEDVDYLKVAACYNEDGLMVDYDIDFDMLKSVQNGWDEWKGPVREHPPVPDW